MKLGSMKLIFALGVLSLACFPVFGEHSGSAKSIKSLTRPSSLINSAKQADDIVSACFAGRGGGALTGINPGLEDIGTQIGAEGRGNIPSSPVAKSGAASAAALMPAKCLKCHKDSPKSPDAAIAVLTGKKTAPKEMTAFLAGLSAAEKTQFVNFFKARKAAEALP